MFSFTHYNLKCVYFITSSRASHQYGHRSPSIPLSNNIKSNFECNENNQTKPTIHSRSCPAFIHSEIIIHDDKSATHAPIIGNTVTSTTCLKEIKG